MYRYFYAYFCLWSLIQTGNVFADITSERLRFSQPKIELVQGDILKLRIEHPHKKNLQVNWFKRGLTICIEKLLCSIDTTDWTPTKYNIRAVGTHSKGTFSLDFEILVKDADVLYESQIVDPPLISSSHLLQRTNKKQITVRNVRGITSIRNDSMARSITPDNRLVSTIPGDIITASLNTISTIKKQDHFKLYLLPRSKVFFVADVNENTILSLVKGTTRWRTTHFNEPRGSLFVDDWLQLDLNELGDVVVEKTQTSDGTRQAKISVLQGLVRIVRITDKKPHRSHADMVIGYLPSGSCAIVTPSSSALPPHPCQSKKLTPLVRQTTPELFLGIEKEKIFLSKQELRYFSDPKTALSNAMKLQALGKNYAALAPMGQLNAKIKGDPELAFITANASRKFYLFNQASRLLEVSLESTKRKGQSHFMLGLMSLASEDMDQASEHFKKSLQASHLYKEEANYYLGIISFYNKEPVAAQKFLTYATWASKKGEIQSSTQSFLNKIESQRRTLFDGTIAPFYDSNVLNLDSNNSLNIDLPLEATEGQGIALNETLIIHGGKGSNFNADASVSLNQRILFEKSQSVLNLFDETLRFKAQADFFRSNSKQGEAKLSKIDLPLRIEPEIIFRGVQFNDYFAGIDYGWNMTLGLLTKWEPRLTITNRKFYDSTTKKIPNIDWYLWETLSEPSDRSQVETDTQLSCLVPFSEFLKSLRKLRGKLTFGLKTNRYLNSENSDHNTIGLNSRLTYRPQQRLEIMAELDLRQRSFIKSLDTRTDVIMRFKSQAEYQMFPAYNLFGGFSWESQKSSRTTRTYSKIVAQAGLQARI